MTRRSIALAWLTLTLAACQDPAGGRDDATGGTTDAATGTDDGATDDAGTTGEVTGDSGLDEESGGSEETGDPPPPDPGDPFDAPPPVEPLPDERLADLQIAIDGWLADTAVSSADQGVLVVDPATDQVLYERSPDVPRIPASNTKLFTTAVALETLGEDHRPRAEVWGGSTIDGNGVVSGDLHLRGQHDFSWSQAFYAASRTPLDLLAESLYDAGLREVQGGIVARGEFLYDGYNYGTYDPLGHRTEAAARFREALLSEGITVTGGTSTEAAFEPPAGTSLLGHWDGPPMSVVTVPVNVVSHNEFADILLRHVGWELAGTSTYPSGASEIYAWFDGLGLDSEGMEFNDGSGLSHDNRVSPRQVVGLLDTMTTLPEGVAWRRTFSIAGVRGTLGGRMLGANTLGRVHGKTGTLTGTIATSGVVYNRWDRREYLFSILMNNTGSSGPTRAIHDGVIGEIAADFRGLPTPPPAPVLRSVQHDPSTTVATITWDPVDGAEGYLVWLSRNGQAWYREDARYVAQSPYRAGDLPFASPELFVRVSAWSEGGEGDRSDVYSVLVEDRPRRALVVDGNDRWQSQPQPENPMGLGHDFAAVNAWALAGTELGWDTAANEAIVDGAVVLEDYDLVVWSLGEESTVEETFSPAEQGLVADYLDAGGALFVSGAEIGWDLVDQGDANDQAFFADVLRAQYLGDESGTYVVRPTGELGDLPLWGMFTPGALVVGYADRLAPAGGGQAVASYVRGIAGDAAVLSEGPGPVLLMGFPFEAIDNAADRAALMGRAVQLLQ